MTGAADNNPGAARRGARWPLTLFFGVALILFCEVFLFIDVQARGGAVVPLGPGEFIRPAQTTFNHIARWVALNITPLCWVGYLFTFDGLLTRLARTRGDRTISSVRARPHRFVVAWLTSIPVWCFFDWVNFARMEPSAWQYHNLPAVFGQRVVGYFIAFAAISPGMFLVAQWYQHLGLFKWRRTGDERSNRAAWLLTVGVCVLLALIALKAMAHHSRFAGQGGAIAIAACTLLAPALVALAVTRCVFATSFAFGVSFVTFAVGVRDPIGNLTLWVGLIYLLDPLCYWFARGGGGGSGPSRTRGSALAPIVPSLIADWRAGRWGRTAALMAGGATCGLLWEFWNYWAITKWSYNLPFLGELERIRYFEMPVPGFLGFLPFAIECWVVLNAIVLVLCKLRLRVAEPLPDEHAIM